MGTYANIGTQIKSIIQTNITMAQSVYDYVERNPTGYPSISIEAFDGNGEFADTTRNRRSHIFRIIVTQERVKVGASEAERITKAVVDQIIATFDDRTNLNLNNSCDFAYPIPSKWGYINAPDVDIRSAEILLEAVSIV